MEHGAHGLDLTNALLILGFALVAVLVFRRAGLGATLGYLVAGVLLGPQVLALVTGAEQMAVVAEFGIVMLMFVVGLELNPARLWRLRAAIFGFGFAQVMACGLALTAMILALTGFTFEAAIAIGLPLALSSTAQVLPMLQSAGRLRTPFGEKAFSVLLFQDLSLIPMITIVAAMSRNPADQEGPAGWILALTALAAIAGLILAGRLIIRPLFRLIGGLAERELFIVAALFTVVASAALMQSLGLSAALGAFIAGVMLADTPYRHELEADIEPFRSILLGLFFVSVGMLLDLQAVAERPFDVIGFAVLLIVVKTAIIFGIGMIAGMTWRSALALGLLLSQGGEFAFLLYAQAEAGMLIASESASIFGAVVTLSMAATPFLMMATRHIPQEQAGQAEEREAPSNQAASAVVVGCGRFGQTVSQTLRLAGLSVTAIDRKASQIDIAGEFGSKVYFGDGTRLDLLRQAGGADAQAIMFCIDEALEPALLESVHEAFPDALIYVRGFDRRSVIDLANSPAQYVMREVFESAIAMAARALDKLGVSDTEIARAEDKYRKFDAERLNVQIEKGDIYAAQDMTREQMREMQENSEKG